MDTTMGNAINTFLNVFVLGLMIGLFYVSSTVDAAGVWVRFVWDSRVWFPVASVGVFMIGLILVWGLSEHKRR